MSRFSLFSFIEMFHVNFCLIVLCDLDRIDSEDVEDTTAGGGLKTEEVAAEVDVREQKLLGIINIKLSLVIGHWSFTRK